MNTKDFMRNVYDSVSSGLPDVLEAEKVIGEEIHLMTEKLVNRLSDEDIGTVRNMLFAVQTMSMREGYILGAKHAAAIMSEI